MAIVHNKSQHYYPLLLSNIILCINKWIYYTKKSGAGYFGNKIFPITIQRQSLDNSQ